MITLRDYQTAAVDAVRAAYRAGARAPLLVLPTGGGKTIVFSSIADAAKTKNNSVLILVHRAELLTQASDKLTAFSVPHALISPRFDPDYTNQIQIASVQTLTHRLEKLAPPSLIIIDEAHHALAGNSWGKILQAFPSAKILGVTATPERGDGKGLGVAVGGFFDSLIQGPTVAELTRRGFLAPIAHYASKNTLDLSRVRIQAGDYHAQDLENAVNKPTITGDAVAHYTKLCKHAPAVAFCVSVKHAQNVAEVFSDAGYRARALDGTTDPETRRQTLADLGAGRLDIVTSCAIISEGTDLPAVTAAILLAPTKSLGLYMQRVGRVLRPAPGKEKAIIIDHAGDCFRHGLADDPRDWNLNGREKRKARNGADDVPVRQCPECFGAHKPAPVCPYCGHKYAPAPRQIDEKKGDLEIVSGRVKIELRREQGRAQTFAELQAIEKQRGYKPGWARHIWRSRGGKFSCL